MARLPDGFRLATDANGDPAPGAYLYVYRRGTTTPVTTYSDSALTTPNSHPVEADASGAFGPIYLAAGSYKVKMTTALGVDLPGLPIDGVECADEIISVADLTAAAAAAIYPATEVRVRSEGLFYTYSAAEPDVTSKFQDANGYWYGEPATVISDRPTPQEFGAVGDAVTVSGVTTGTDDSAAINAWAAYLRDNNVRGYWPGGEYFTGTTTLYLGAGTFDCGGSPLNERWTGVKTVVKSNANPIACNSEDADTAVTYTNTAFGGLALCYAGGAVAPIDLWDYLDYPYQVGFWWGRNFNNVNTVATGETADDGVGAVHLLGLTIQDCAGWGVVQYKGWGDSSISEVQIRCCGGKAAYELGVALGDAEAGDKLGGGVFVTSVSVDSVYRDIHGFNGNNALGALGSSNYDSRGTFLRVGATKTVTDGLGRGYYSPNKIDFDNCHSEGYADALVTRAAKAMVIRNCNFNGGSGLIGGITIGDASNPSTDLRVIFDSTRLAGNKYIRLCQGDFTSIGLCVNATPAFVIPIQYWRRTAGDFLGSGFSVADLTAAGFALQPQPDPTTAPGGAGITDNTTWLPYMRTAALPSDGFSNEVPSFNGGSGTTLATWASSGAGTLAVSATGTFVTLTNEKTVTCNISGLTAGDLYTVEFGVEWTGAIGMGNLICSVIDGSAATVISRAIGSGLQTDGLEYRCFQFTVPDGETEVDFKLRNGDTNGAIFYAPTVTRGSPTPRGRATPYMWIARDGIYATA